MSVKQNPKSGSWQYRFKWRGVPCFGGGFRTQKQAQEAEAREKDRVIRNHISPERAGDDILFQDAIETYYKEYVLTTRSENLCRARMPFLKTFFEGKTLTQITPDDISAMTKVLSAEGLTDHTVNRYHSLVKAMYNWFRKVKRLEISNPAWHIALRKVPGGRVRFLYPAEEASLTPAVQQDPRLWPYYWAALKTGMRISELCQVQVKEVSLFQRHIFIPDSKSNESGYAPIPEDLVPWIEQWIAGKGPDDFLFCGVTRYAVGTWFRRLLVKMGVPDFTFHDLRHTFAHRLLSRGTPIYIVSKLLRHSSVTVTEKHYGHLAQKELKDAVDSGLVRAYSSVVIPGFGAGVGVLLGASPDAGSGQHPGHGAPGDQGADQGRVAVRGAGPLGPGGALQAPEAGSR